MHLFSLFRYVKMLMVEADPGRRIIIEGLIKFASQIHGSECCGLNPCKTSPKHHYLEYCKLFIIKELDYITCQGKNLIGFGKNSIAQEAACNTLRLQSINGCENLDNVRTSSSLSGRQCPNAVNFNIGSVALQLTRISTERIFAATSPQCPRPQPSSLELLYVDLFSKVVENPNEKELITKSKNFCHSDGPFITPPSHDMGPKLTPSFKSNVWNDDLSVLSFSSSSQILPTSRIDNRFQSPQILNFSTTGTSTLMTNSDSFVVSSDTSCHDPVVSKPYSFEPTVKLSVFMPTMLKVDSRPSPSNNFALVATSNSFSPTSLPYEIVERPAAQNSQKLKIVDDAFQGLE